MGSPTDSCSTAAVATLAAIAIFNLAISIQQNSAEDGAAVVVSRWISLLALVGSLLGAAAILARRRSRTN